MRCTSPPDEDPDEITALEDKFGKKVKLNETPTLQLVHKNMATEDMAN